MLSGRPFPRGRRLLQRERSSPACLPHSLRTTLVCHHRCRQHPGCEVSERMVFTVPSIAARTHDPWQSPFRACLDGLSFVKGLDANPRQSGILNGD